MGKIGKLFGQTIIYGLGTIVPRFLNFAILTPYFTRIFEPREYGIITEFYAYVIVLQVLLTYGMETGYFRFCRDEKRKGETYSVVLTSILISSVAFIAICFITGAKIAEVLGYEKRGILVNLVGSIVALDAFAAIPFAKLRMEGKALKFAVIKILNVIITLVFVFGFLSLLPIICNKYEGSILCNLYNKEFNVEYVFIANLIASFFVLILLYKEIFSTKLRFDFYIFKNILKFSLPILIAGLSGSFAEALDRIMLKYLLPQGQNSLYALGIYGANIKLSVIMMIYVQMFRYAAEPFYFENMYEKESRKLFADVMKYFIIIGMFIFLLLNFNLNIIKIFIGVKYYEGLSIVPVVMFGYLLMGILNNASIWYKITKNTMIGAYISIIGALLTLLFNIILVPKFGYVGAAWTRIIAFSIMTILCIFFGNRKFFIPYNYTKIVGIVSLGFFLYSIFILCGLDKRELSFVFSIVFIILYSIIIVAFNKEIKNGLKSILFYGRSKN